MPIRSQTDPFKSDEERYFWQVGQAVLEGLAEFQGAEVTEMTYEALTFDIAGTNYTEDFYVKMRLKDGPWFLVCVEVKGSKKQRGYRETKAKLTSASSLYPEFIFVEVFINVNRRKDRLGVPRVSCSISGVSFVSKPPFRRVTHPAEYERFLQAQSPEVSGD